MKKFIIIGIVVLVLIIGGVVGFLMLSGGDKAPKPVVMNLHNIVEMYSNIADEGKILKLELTIEYTEVEFLETFTKEDAKIKNTILEYFRNKSFESLTRSNGQERAREELAEMFIELLKTDSTNITNVYFKQFIIQ